MFDYKQRTTTDEYRDNWERIWGEKKLKEFGDFPDEDGRTWVDYGYSESMGCKSDSGHHCSCVDYGETCCICTLEEE